MATQKKASTDKTLLAYVAKHSVGEKKFQTQRLTTDDCGSYKVLRDLSSVCWGVPAQFTLNEAIQGNLFSASKCLALARCKLGKTVTLAYGCHPWNRLFCRLVDDAEGGVDSNLSLMREKLAGIRAEIHKKVGKLQKQERELAKEIKTFERKNKRG